MNEKKLSKGAREAQKVINAYRRLFSTEDGQIVLQDLMKCCYIGRSVIGPTPYETYFNEGVRSVALRLMGQVNMQEKDVERILTEMSRQSEDILL